jgi:hypothetical protein
MAEVVDGGSYVREDDDQQVVAAQRADVESYMGLFPVGGECKKRLRADGVVVLNTKNWDQGS